MRATRIRSTTRHLVSGTCRDGDSDDVEGEGDSGLDSDGDADSGREGDGDGDVDSGRDGDGDGDADRGRDGDSDREVDSGRDGDSAAPAVRSRYCRDRTTGEEFCALLMQRMLLAGYDPCQYSDFLN
ncbi:hypothetical protein [Streptomyces sp. NPDC048309]|uniref:hypothetical protein n=1 Tax=Streptomyces sp. NPDC048309 TaxID=3154618 RepID=UPI0033DDF5D7